MNWTGAAQRSLLLDGAFREPFGNGKDVYKRQEHSGVITVRIIFYRATSVILNVVKCKRHTELHTETEHFRNFLALVSYHFLVHLHCAQVIDRDVYKRQGQVWVIHLLKNVWKKLIGKLP